MFKFPVLNIHLIQSFIDGGGFNDMAPSIPVYVKDIAALTKSVVFLYIGGIGKKISKIKKLILNGFQELKVVKLLKYGLKHTRYLSIQNCEKLCTLLIGPNCLYQFEHPAKGGSFIVSHCKNLKEISIEHGSFYSFTHCRYSGNYE